MFKEKFNSIILYSSVTLFVVSLTQPAFYVEGENFAAWSNSFLLLFIGWIGNLLGGGSAFVWLSNPLIIISWFFMKKSSKVSLICATIASILSISFLFFNQVITSEAPSYSRISEYKLGYWIWTISILTFTTGIWINSLLVKNGK